MDVELHRHSLGEDSVYPQSSESDVCDAPPPTLTLPAAVKASAVAQSPEPAAAAPVGEGNAGLFAGRITLWVFFSCGEPLARSSTMKIAKLKLFSVLSFS